MFDYILRSTQKAVLYEPFYDTEVHSLLQMNYYNPGSYEMSHHDVAASCGVRDQEVRQIAHCTQDNDINLDAQFSHV